MAHQAVKPYSFLMYFLASIAFFFLGLAYAGVTQAGKGQMLASGAIVLGYGVIGMLIGFILALIAAFKVRRSIILRLNVVLILIIAASLIFLKIKNQKRQKARSSGEQAIMKEPTIPILTDSVASDAMDIKWVSDDHNQTNSKIGLGMFSPNYREGQTMYFYRNLTAGKPIQDHKTTDSITFKRLENGGVEIAAAPPWLVPAHLKLDYDILYFKVVSESRDVVEVVVNKTNGQTAIVDKYAGNLQYWPEFFLGVNSVEFIDTESPKIFVKPLDHAALVNRPYTFMSPQRVEQSWMSVKLMNDDFEAVGEGWIKWRDNEKLLISYSLLN